MAGAKAALPWACSGRSETESSFYCQDARFNATELSDSSDFPAGGRAGMGLGGVGAL